MDVYDAWIMMALLASAWIVLAVRMHRAERNLHELAVIVRGMLESMARAVEENRRNPS